MAHKGGFAEDDTVDSITAEEMDGFKPHGSAILGTNAREQAQRAHRLLRWKPERLGLEDEIQRAFAVEVENVKG